MAGGGALFEMGVEVRRSRWGSPVEEPDHSVGSLRQSREAVRRWLTLLRRGAEASTGSVERHPLILWLSHIWDHSEYMMPPVGSGISCEQ